MAASEITEAKSTIQPENKKFEAAVEQKYQTRTNQLITFPSGIMYQGEWHGVLKHGYGVQIWPDGARYEG